MDLRPATVADIPAIARVHVASWRAAYSGLVPESYLQVFTYERREEPCREFQATGAAETCVMQWGKKAMRILTPDPGQRPGRG